MHVPFWSSAEPTFGAKYTQQTRHFLGFQDAVYSVRHSEGLGIMDRVAVVYSAASPMAAATFGPVCGVGIGVLNGSALAPWVPSNP